MTAQVGVRYFAALAVVLPACASVKVCSILCCLQLPHVVSVCLQLLWSSGAYIGTGMGFELTQGMVLGSVPRCSSYQLRLILARSMMICTHRFKILKVHRLMLWHMCLRNMCRRSDRIGIVRVGYCFRGTVFPRPCLVAAAVFAAVQARLSRFTVYSRCCDSSAKLSASVWHDSGRAR